MVYIAFPQIDYPKDSDMMQVFECQETLQYKYAVTLLAVMPPPNILTVSIYTLCFRYRLALLKPCQKAVNQSTKISIRMDRRGFLSLQCMILTNDKQVCFVEYLVSPLLNSKKSFN